MWLGLPCDTENDSAGQEVPLPPPPPFFFAESEGLLPCSQQPATSHNQSINQSKPKVSE